MSAVIGPTLASLLQNAQFTRTARVLKSEGWLDWHLLIAIVNIDELRFHLAALQGRIEVRACRRSPRRSSTHDVTGPSAPAPGPSRGSAVTLQWREVVVDRRLAGARAEAVGQPIADPRG
ncbi:hypothetical protein QFZ26_001033 [Agromyces ramosus]|uniref:Uncharacterized protein n=1 Tax=Agromyces ramosus TaxID=33879 RepID=A0ABU0R5W9_9MICO|nr:hypothetical protein [Agromyces ramosus]